MNEAVTTQRRDKVLEITIDRPPVNAVSQAVTDALHEAFVTLRDDSDLVVGIITGGGERIFSAGWDLKEVAAATDSAEALGDPESGGGFAGFTEMWDLYKPVIAAVNGVAIGGGFEIALAADVIIAAEHAEFWLPEMQRGFLADAGAIQKLPRRIPYNVAMEMMMSGRRMDAAEAKHWGLVHEVVALDRLMETSRELADLIATSAPLALQALKESMPELMNMPLREAFAATKLGKKVFPIVERMLNSEDFMEGPRAFAEKRDPVWKG